MTAAVVALAIALASVTVAGMLAMVAIVAWTRAAMTAEVAATKAQLAAETKEARATLAADTADALRVAAETKTKRVSLAIDACVERTADALTEPKVYPSRAAAVAHANELLSPALGIAATAAADRRPAGGGPAVPADSTASSARPAALGVR